MTSWFPLLAKNVHEIRIHLCQTSPASKGVRDFINQNYLAIKKANPENFPFLIREASGIQAKAFARYDKGVERKVMLDNLKAEDVGRKLKELAESIPK